MHKQTVSTATRSIGEGQACYLIAEVGTTCMGDIDKALALVRAGRTANVDAVKFQVIDARQMSDESVTYPIVIDGRETRVSMKEMFEKLKFSEAQWKAVADECQQNGLDFFATVDYPDGVDMLERVGASVHKIGAWDGTYRPLIERIGATGKPMFVDLGPATPDEITDIVNWYQTAGGSAVLFLHDFHTAEDTEMNLRTIRFLNNEYPWPAGFSSPARDDDLDFAALALGAHVIEKRLILNRSDFAFHAHESLEPEELSAWVQRIRHVERALGRAEIIPSRKDREMSHLYYRSACTLTPIKSGEALTSVNLGAKRPGTGIPASRLPELWKRHAARDLPANTLVSEGDFA